MTSNEILLLATGIALGAQLTNALHAYWGWRDISRSNATARRLARVLAADHYLDSLRLYRTQRRSSV
ncbi:hypothetical protein [Streptomyces formicae]